MMNPKTFPELPSNTCDLATSVFDPVLGLGAAASILPTANSAWICAYIIVSCSYYCWIICSKFALCWLILCSNVGKMDDDSGDDKERAKLVLVSLSNSYLLFNSILVDTSRLPFCPTLHCLLTTLFY